MKAYYKSKEVKSKAGTYMKVKRKVDWRKNKNRWNLIKRGWGRGGERRAVQGKWDLKGCCTATMWTMNRRTII